MSSCTGRTRSGEPCGSTARPGSSPPRCGRHPTDPADRTGHQKRQAFLDAFAQIGNVTDAAALAGIRRQAHYEWLADTEYADAFDRARDQSADRLESEAMRRAVEGLEEPVWYRGEQVGTTRRYSDVLLIFLLKGLRPEKYRDNWRPPEPTKPVRFPWDPKEVIAEAKERADALRPLSKAPPDPPLAEQTPDKN